MVRTVWGGGYYQGKSMQQSFKLAYFLVFYTYHLTALITKATHANLPHEVTLIADGVEVPLPDDSQGIILLNIDSYAGGIPMWSHATKSGVGRGYGDMFNMGPDGFSVEHRRSHSLE